MLTIEDGTIVDGANSYVSIADVVAYALLYGFSFTGTDVAREQAIARAMIYIEALEPCFYGSRVSAAQSLAWPRNYVPNALGTDYLANTLIPTGLKNAVSEAAILELATPGTLTQAASVSSQSIVRERRKVGPLETETQYSAGTSTTETMYKRINAFLQPFLNGGRASYLIRGH